MNKRLRDDYNYSPNNYVNNNEFSYPIFNFNDNSKTLSPISFNYINNSRENINEYNYNNIDTNKKLIIQNSYELNRFLNLINYGYCNNIYYLFIILKDYDTSNNNIIIIENILLKCNNLKSLYIYKCKIDINFMSKSIFSLKLLSLYGCELMNFRNFNDCQLFQHLMLLKYLDISYFYIKNYSLSYNIEINNNKSLRTLKLEDMRYDININIKYSNIVNLIVSNIKRYSYTSLNLINLPIFRRILKNYKGTLNIKNINIEHCKKLYFFDKINNILSDVRINIFDVDFKLLYIPNIPLKLNKKMDIVKQIDDFLKYFYITPSTSNKFDFVIKLTNYNITEKEFNYYANKLLYNHKELTIYQNNKEITIIKYYENIIFVLFN